MAKITGLPDYARKIASEMYPQVSRTYSQWEVEKLLIAVLNEAENQAEAEGITHDHTRCIRLTTPTLFGLRLEAYYGCMGHYITMSRMLEPQGKFRQQVKLFTFRLPYKKD